MSKPIPFRYEVFPNQYPDIKLAIQNTISAPALIGTKPIEIANQNFKVVYHQNNLSFLISGAANPFMEEIHINADSRKVPKTMPEKHPVWGAGSVLSIPLADGNILKVLGYSKDVRNLSEQYGDAIALQYKVNLPPQPSVYCTWYHARASDEKSIAENTMFANKFLKPRGFHVIQIDVRRGLPPWEKYFQ